MNGTTQSGGGESVFDRPVTPEELRSMTFPRAPLTRRGYVEEDVHATLRRAAEALGHQIEDNTRLRVDLQRQRDWIRANNITGDSTPIGVPGVDAVLQQARAQELADQTISNAHRQAKGLVQAARAQAEAILRQSHEQASMMVAQATTQGLGEAGHESVERLVAAVRRTAEALMADVDAISAQRAPMATVVVDTRGAAPDPRLA
ncbi:hypothetical protein OG568_05115 [Streptomyces sp. NBC_01450]|uniref:DivIVA domain-containing protein n=1 Tax=Streptomyces sp. NBC_01450 TaxID=2903871 RepID=UPI002E3022B0|nr:hypothetical protein [Streptomyces sp. NBC_01450]